MTDLTVDDVHEYARETCFRPALPGKVGAETEWLVTDTADPSAPVPLDRLAALLEEAGPPPAGSRLSFEPGGQVELSSPALPGPARTHEALAADIGHVRKALAQEGLVLGESGLDPLRGPLRQRHTPRYTSMDRFFTGRSRPSGTTMMCSTASLQVCLDTGADADDVRARWELLHRLGPVFVAAFANSAFWRGRPTGWKSTRWAVWAGMDADRTRPVPGPTASSDPAADWAGYLLGADVLAIPAEPGGGGAWTVDPGITLAEWIAGGGARPPARADLELHASLLFPPVRPRGWWEVRMIDALPQRWWPVPVAVAAALLDDPHARAAAEEATARLCGGRLPDRVLSLRAARLGPADPDVGACARTCLDAAVEALPRMGAASLAVLTDSYAEQYTRRGLCPADTRPQVPAPRPARTDSRTRGGTR